MVLVTGTLSRIVKSPDRAREIGLAEEAVMTVALLLAVAPDRLSAMAQPYRHPGDKLPGSPQIEGAGGRLQQAGVRQVEIAREECYCPVEIAILAGTGHSPHREAQEATLNATSEFASAVLRTHEGSEGRAA